MQHPTVQLATLVAAPPEGDDWLHEQKFDGYRILAELDGDKVRLSSRRGHDWTTKFPTIAEAVAKLPAKRAVLDGEVASVGSDGRTSFQALQNAIGRRDPSLVYYVFDLLAVDDDQLVARTLEQRKARLRTLVAKAPSTIHYSDHVRGRGSAVFAAACEQGIEGIVSKLRTAPYRPGRGTTWLKTKCIKRQELVIGGFTEGERSDFGALLVGYYERGRLVYAGKVGTGFSAKVLAELQAKLGKLAIATSPFTPVPPRASTGPSPHWVEPSLVAEVAFTEWTESGRLRHPSFQGLRADKAAREVVREVAV